MNGDATLTVGIYQPRARDETPRERLSRLEAVFDEPAVRGCDLLVCPELYMSGYFVDDRLIERAEPSDGEFSRGVRRLAGGRQCAIAYGYPERAGADVYNAALCAGPDGGILANHRKNLLPYEYEENYFRRGDRPNAFDLKGWKIGLLICFEVEFPEPVRYHTLSGCQLVIAPTALVDAWPVVAQRTIPSRAFENSIFVAYANHAGEENGNRYLGQSVIASPWGEDLARAGTDEAVLIAALDRAEIGRAASRVRFLEHVGRSCYG